MMYNNLLLKSENGRHSKTWKSCKGGKFSRLQLESFALCRVMVTLTYVICRLVVIKMPFSLLQSGHHLIVLDTDFYTSYI